MAMRTINVILPVEPPEGSDPLRDFLLFDSVHDGLLRLGIDPENPAHIERTGRQSLLIHFSVEGDTGERLRALLESFRGLMGYTIRRVELDESLSDDLPPEMVIALEQ